MVNAVKVFTLRLCISAYYIHFKRVKVKIFTAFTIDEKVQEQGIDKYSLFYKTDHHWTTKSGLWACNQIADKL